MSDCRHKKGKVHVGPTTKPAIWKWFIASMLCHISRMNLVWGCYTSINQPSPLSKYHCGFTVSPSYFIMSNLCQTTGASHGEMWGCAQPRWNMEHWNIMELCGIHMMHWVAHWKNSVTSLCGIPWRFFRTRETVFCQLNTLKLGHVHGYLPMESEPRTKGDQVGSLWIFTWANIISTYFNEY